MFAQLSFPGFALVAEIVVVLFALIVAPKNRRPSSALAWIFLIAAVPIAGIVLFALIGSPHLPRGRRDVQQRMNDRILDLSRDSPGPTARFGGPDWLPAVAKLNRAVGAMPLLRGNDADLLTDWDDQLAAMIEAIDGATRYLHVEFYILSLDATTAPFFDALQRAHDRGVVVRVLVDHMGSWGYPGFRRSRRWLKRSGIAWHLMLPVQPYRGRYQRPDLRNHRKLLVADGVVAFVGSPNLIDPGYEKLKNRRRKLRWKDLLVRVGGPIVREVDAVFLTDWYSETGDLLPTAQEEVTEEHRQGELVCQIAPSGPAYTFENNLALFTSLIFAATTRLSITSPYFVPDDSLLNAITTAARRGVEVELFVGEIGDQFGVFHAQHSYYAPLLDAGVRIYLYPKPAILHAKHMSVDDDVAVVGSSNMDIRSFQLDFEVTLLVSGRPFVDSLRRVEDDYRARSAELTREEWEHRSPFHTMIDDLMRLTSAVQ